METKFYYIQDSRTYSGNALMWWSKGGGGYTANIDNAGKYTEEQAKHICKRESDTAWPCEYIDAVPKVSIIDSQRLSFKNRRTWRVGRKKKPVTNCLHCGKKTKGGDFCSEKHELEWSNNLPF